MEDEDEILDIVDKNDNVIGQKIRAEIYQNKQSNFRVVNAFLENNKGEIFILIRTEEKTPYPLGLDMSIGGHVKSGETYEDALKREMKEELGINISDTHCMFLGYLSPYVDSVSAFMKVYKIDRM